MLNYDREYILNRDVHRLKYSRRKYLLHFCSGDKNYRIYLLTAIAVLLVLIVSIVIYISTTHSHPKEDEYFGAASGNIKEKYKGVGEAWSMYILIYQVHWYAHTYVPLWYIIQLHFTSQ